MLKQARRKHVTRFSRRAALVLLIAALMLLSASAARAFTDYVSFDNYWNASLGPGGYDDTNGWNY